MQPPAPFVPSMFGQLRPMSTGSFAHFLPYVTFVNRSKVRYLLLLSVYGYGLIFFFMMI